MISEGRLATRAAEGDRRAFAEIYDRYHQDLYRFCLAMVGNPHDAQDALQNTMVKVLRALPGEQREIKLKPWLYRIARNESVETLRKRRDAAMPDPQEAGGLEVAETAETRERLRVLLSDLEQLPPRQRAALVMRELSGLEFAEIAASFGSSPAVARQTLYEARLSLRQLQEGREMRCAEVTRELSDADGRVTRRRAIRAHLRSCTECRAFRDEIGERHRNLAAVAPLPAVASVGLLRGMLGTDATATGAGVAGPIGAGAGKTVAASAIAKSAAVVAAATVAGVGVADRSGLIDLPLPGKSQAAQDRGADGDPSAARSSTAQERAGAPKGDRDTNGRRSASADGRQSGAGGSNADHRDGADPARAHGETTNSTASQAGSEPPGNGFGRSASERHGRPDELPEAAGNGQQTANGKRPPQATEPPGLPAGAGGHREPPPPPVDKPPPAAPPGHEDPPGPPEPPAPDPGKGGKPEGLPGPPNP